MTERQGFFQRARQTVEGLKDWFYIQKVLRAERRLFRAQGNRMNPRQQAFFEKQLEASSLEGEPYHPDGF